MLSVNQFRKQGFLYETIENYSDLINIEEYKSIKTDVDSVDFKKPSRYDYLYKYGDQSYIETLQYETFLKNDKASMASGKVTPA